ncbi:hypothetical protein IEQ34_021544 [Dendrobium chrysotoxum]|uniref:Uncharacterized protein n=1 Tax=Dendrobium chrysotoxum TaxID=161865 RepID=A0AAV7G3U4_DENCH|nr:hypothetical protein IEQ34_021544 [Dendrobium chrysotoxum]
MNVHNEEYVAMLFHMLRYIVCNLFIKIRIILKLLMKHTLKLGSLSSMNPLMRMKTLPNVLVIMDFEVASFDDFSMCKI